MLAEQHCVCTKSGLKNVFSTRCVVGRWGGTFFFFFTKMVLEYSKSKLLSTPFQCIISYSFWGCQERCSPAAELTLQWKLPPPRNTASPGYTLHHQKDHSRLRCKGGVLMSSDCPPSTHPIGKKKCSRYLWGCAEVSYSSTHTKKMYDEKTYPFPINTRAKDFKAGRGQKKAQKGR